jgi:hypothetical protein
MKRPLVGAAFSDVHVDSEAQLVVVSGTGVCGVWPLDASVEAVWVSTETD